MIHFHFPSSATTCTVCVTLNPPAKPRRTSTALLSRNLPSPIPTDSSFTLSTFTERGTAITGLRVSQPTYSENGATSWSIGCRSSQTAEYLLCTIRPTTFEANAPGSSFAPAAPPQPAASTASASSRTSGAARAARARHPGGTPPPPPPPPLPAPPPPRPAGGGERLSGEPVGVARDD